MNPDPTVSSLGGHPDSALAGAGSPRRRRRPVRRDVPQQLLLFREEGEREVQIHGRCARWHDQSASRAAQGGTHADSAASLLPKGTR